MWPPVTCDPRFHAIVSATASSDGGDGGAADNLARIAYAGSMRAPRDDAGPGRPFRRESPQVNRAARVASPVSDWVESDGERAIMTEA